MVILTYAGDMPSSEEGIGRLTSRATTEIVPVKQHTGDLWGLVLLTAARQAWTIKICTM